METVITILAIVACVVLFSVAIFIHEFGHFLAARCLGFKVEAFSIGFGPALWKRTVNGVQYRIGCIPFGGYVALPQLDPEGTKAIETTDEKSGATDGAAVEDIAAWKRVVVAFAGPFGNVVLAVVLAVVLSLASGARFGEVPAIIGEVPNEGPARAAGMLAGDKVLAVEGHPITTWTEMQTELQIMGGRETEFTIERNGKTLPLKITPVQNEATEGWYIMAFSTTNGVGAAAWMPDRNPLKQLAWDAGQIVRVLKALGTPKESKAAAKALGGPVMIAEGLYRQVRRNGWDAMGFLRFLNVNLAMINLLPIPVLDGSLILFALFEIITRRKPPKKFTNMLSTIFMYLLLALMLLLVCRDVKRSYKIHKAENELMQRAQTNDTTNAEEPAK